MKDPEDREMNQKQENNSLVFLYFSVNRKLGGVVVFYISHIYLGHTSVFISPQLLQIKSACLQGIYLLYHA